MTEAPDAAPTWAQPTRAKAFTLYRFWDADGALLYIGITGDPRSRWGAHGREKGWWDQVASVTVEHFNSLEELKAAEIAAIHQEKPRYNIVHANRSWSGKADGSDRESGATPVAAVDQGPLARVVDARATIDRRWEEYRAVLRAALANGVPQVAISQALGRSREMLRRDAMTSDERAALRAGKAPTDWSGKSGSSSPPKL